MKPSNTVTSAFSWSRDQPQGGTTRDRLTTFGFTRTWHLQHSLQMGSPYPWGTFDKRDQHAKHPPWTGWTAHLKVSHAGSDFRTIFLQIQKFVRKKQFFGSFVHDYAEGTEVTENHRINHHSPTSEVHAPHFDTCNLLQTDFTSRQKIVKTRK